jgi:hypothetical protein
MICGIIVIAGWLTYEFVSNLAYYRYLNHISHSMRRDETSDSEFIAKRDSVERTEAKIALLTLGDGLLALTSVYVMIGVIKIPRHTK